MRLQEAFAWHVCCFSFFFQSMKKQKTAVRCAASLHHQYWPTEAADSTKQNKGGGEGNYNKGKKQAGKRYAQRKSLVYLWCVCVSRREQREAAAALRSSAEPSVPPGHPPLSSTASQPLLCPDGKKMCRRQARVLSGDK